MKDSVILVALEQEFPRELLPEYRIEYIGVGKVNACLRTQEVINELSPKTIINFGTAGSLKKDLTGLHEVSNFFQRDMDARALGFEIGETPFDPVSKLHFGRDGISCGTGDNFVNETPLLETDLVDMEAYAIAKACHLRNINFLCFKYISDSADENASKNWQDNISQGAKEFKNKILSLADIL